MEDRKKIKSFVLVEAMVATLMITIVAASLAGTAVLQKAMLVGQLNHVTAINYARSVADKLLNIAYSNPTYFPPSLDLGTHTDAEICTLPDHFFKTKLNGRASYKISEIKISAIDIPPATALGALKMLLVEVVIEWDEFYPKARTVSERLFFTLWRPYGQYF